MNLILIDIARILRTSILCLYRRYILHDLFSIHQFSFRSVSYFVELVVDHPWFLHMYQILWEHPWISDMMTVDINLCTLTMLACWVGWYCQTDGGPARWAPVPSLRLQRGWWRHNTGAWHTAASWRRLCPNWPGSAHAHVLLQHAFGCRPVMTAVLQDRVHVKSQRSAVDII